MWDQLVINTKSFPQLYWDKFVKKKVLNKYSETHDYNQLKCLLGLENETFGAVKQQDQGGLFSL